MRCPFRMAWSRKKRSLLYIVSIGLVVYLGIQMTYFNQTFHPLMDLSDAESEAQRLLKFITMYNFNCNFTSAYLNQSQFPICAEREAGIDTESKEPKIAYSIGPSSDYAFERYLLHNVSSFTVFIFTHERIPLEIKQMNKAHAYQTIVVANDPSDFGRNSYDTQTLNNIKDALKHSQIDILKLDNVADASHSHELLYYLIEDDVLKHVKQLHIVLHIDKLNDDYLYSWYRVMYNLFYKSGFRLYHTSASDPLCLQVTMMESCAYHLSWLQDPGPTAFIIHPPAIDGSIDFEEHRLVDHVTTLQTVCSRKQSFVVTSAFADNEEAMYICNPNKRRIPCHIVYINEGRGNRELKSLDYLRCTVTLVGIVSEHGENIKVKLISIKSPQGKSLSRQKRGTTLLETLSYLHEMENIDVLALHTPSMLWMYLTPLLDSGLLQNVSQLFVDVSLWHSQLEEHPVLLRQRYSELRRLEAQGFRIYHSSAFKKSQLVFVPARDHKLSCCFQLGYTNMNLLINVMK